MSDRLWGTGNAEPGHGQKGDQIQQEHVASAIEKLNLREGRSAVGAPEKPEVEKDQSHTNKAAAGRKCAQRTSLVVPWLRICLPMQGTGSIPGLGRSHMSWGN